MVALQHFDFTAMHQTAAQLRLPTQIFEILNIVKHFQRRKYHRRASLGVGNISQLLRQAPAPLYFPNIERCTCYESFLWCSREIY